MRRRVRALRRAIVVWVATLALTGGTVGLAAASSGSANFQNNPTQYCADYLAMRNTSQTPDRWNLATATPCAASNTVKIWMFSYDTNGGEHILLNTESGSNYIHDFADYDNSGGCPAGDSPCVKHVHEYINGVNDYTKAFFSWQSQD